MSVSLGIDTGGTYTDAVLLDDERGVVIRTAKALTTRYDLSVGIKNAVELVLPTRIPQIKLISLSSTLATNAIVEGKGSSICLLLIGYDHSVVADRGFEKIVPRKRMVFLDGGHNVNGEEKNPLDIKAAQKAIEAHASHVSAFAVSSYFGVRNPAHELRVKKLVHRLTGLPVTCGHELTTQLDAPVRALTVALNARLIPLLQQLILSVRKLMEMKGITAPLMVVKGDGSLMDAAMALERPVETIMSGPAASAIGALYLHRIKDAFVVDMGGTTTDVALVHNGQPVLNLEGARVGGWQTMIEAIDNHTTGLGGDSQIHLDDSGKLHAGPRRVVPLSILAFSHPDVTDILRNQLKGDSPNKHAGCFIMQERPLGHDGSRLSDTQKEIWKILGDGPVALLDVFNQFDSLQYFSYPLNDLIEHGLVAVSSFTPTDAVHVLGKYRSGSVEAAELGAEIWAKWLGVDKQEFCKRLVKQVQVQAGYAVINSALAEEHMTLQNDNGVGNLFIKRALEDSSSGTFDVKLTLGQPIIGIGAPAVTYIKPLAEKFNTELFVPEFAEVANAVGAVAGGIVQHVRVLIRPSKDGLTYRVHSPSVMRDYENLDEAIAYARRAAGNLAKRLAHQAGAHRAKTEIEQNDRIISLQTQNIYLETEIIATAIGRPSFAPSS